jgi:hypothetical protein
MFTDALFWVSCIFSGGTPSSWCWTPNAFLEGWVVRWQRHWCLGTPSGFTGLTLWWCIIQFSTPAGMGAGMWNVPILVQDLLVKRGHDDLLPHYASDTPAKVLSAGTLFYFSVIWNPILQRYQAIPWGLVILIFNPTLGRLHHTRTRIWARVMFYLFYIRCCYKRVKTHSMMMVIITTRDFSFRSVISTWYWSTYIREPYCNLRRNSTF